MSGMQAIQLNESVWHIFQISGFTIEFIFFDCESKLDNRGKIPVKK